MPPYFEHLVSPAGIENPLDGECGDLRRHAPLVQAIRQVAVATVHVAEWRRLQYELTYWSEWDGLDSRQALLARR